MQNAVLRPSDLRSFLRGCGYSDDLLRDGDQTRGATAPALLGFAQLPADVRSACIAVVDGNTEPREAVLDQRQLGAPLVFVCRGKNLQWWRQGTDQPEFLEEVDGGNIEGFFAEHLSDFGPDTIYRAKTWGRFQTSYQLSFVDVGLLPLVEAELGDAIGGLIERVVDQMKAELGWSAMSDEQAGWILQSVFWLVSGKILSEKGVAAFSKVELGSVEEVFQLVAAHYGSAPLSVESLDRRLAAQNAAAVIDQFASLELTTTEALASVYENTLISDATRSILGTHSTPSYLVDYVVGNLAEWISEIPEPDRRVFEPACGHAAFLVSAMRLLSELLPDQRSSASSRRAYLREHVKGLDLDSFALELARLSLTLTDIPNPDGWDLVTGDMFIDSRLAAEADGATIVLANPPFEGFGSAAVDQYSLNPPTFHNKAAEVVWQLLTGLPKGGVFGFVVPQGFLRSASARSIRELLVREFEIKEILMLPDKVFSYSDVETAVLLGRRASVSPTTQVRCRQVREKDLPRFKQDYIASSDQSVPQSHFFRTDTYSLRVPSLLALWEGLSELPALSQIADLGQGLFFKGESSLPAGAVRTSTVPTDGFRAGYTVFGRNLHTHELPTEHWLNLSEDVIDRAVMGTTVDEGQVLLNYAPASRGPWRLRALLDVEGHAVTNRFVPVRPIEDGWGLEVLWAILNSPVANAFAYSHLGKRENLVGLLRKIPMPTIGMLGQVEERALEYLDAVRSGVDTGDAFRLMTEIDAAVFDAYDLPDVLERALAELFCGHLRVGVPFRQKQLMPPEVGSSVGFRSFRAYESSWVTTNQRRGVLIDKDIDGDLSSEEAAELESLQQYADFYLDRLSLHSTAALDVFERLAFGGG